MLSRVPGEAALIRTRTAAPDLCLASEAFRGRARFLPQVESSLPVTQGPSKKNLTVPPASCKFHTVHTAVRAPRPSRHSEGWPLPCSWSPIGFEPSRKATWGVLVAGNTAHSAVGALQSVGELP